MGRRGDGEIALSARKLPALRGHKTSDTRTLATNPTPGGGTGVYICLRGGEGDDSSLSFFAVKPNSELTAALVCLVTGGPTTLGETHGHNCTISPSNSHFEKVS